MDNFIAHRGNDNHIYKENTKEAILESLKRDYIKGVEFDIRMTKDKKIVIIHNSMINHASNGWGFVKYMTLKQIRKYNFGTKEHPTKIATLEQVLREITSNKKIVIEFKEETDNFKVFINKVYKIINKYRHLNLYFYSFNHELIKYYKENYSNIKTGVLFLLYPDLKKTNSYSDFFAVNHLFFDKVTTSKEIMIWTVNDKDDYNKIKSKLNNNISVITDKAYFLKEK